MDDKISLELAEICGIHAGDGYLRGKDHKKELDISGNIEEKDYYDIHIKELFKKEFGVDIMCKFFNSRNTYGFVIRDKKIIEFMKELGFPYNKKSAIVQVPEKVKLSKDNKIICSFLRGLFDTDGCLHFWIRKGKYCDFKKTHHYYPVISFTTVSEKLFNEIKELLRKLGFENLRGYKTISPKINERDKYTLRLYGVEKTNKFFKEIGSKNPVKLSRFLVWKKLGYCPANTTLKERLEMLKNPSN